MPLIITLRIILIAAAAPVCAPTIDVNCMSSSRKQRRDRLGMRAGDQHRRPVPRRMDRRDHRDVDIARRVAEQRSVSCLRPGETELMSR